MKLENIVTGKQPMACTIIVCLGLLTFCCEDFIEVGPPKTEITSETLFANDAAAVSAVRGIYSLMMTNTSFTRGEIERYTGLSSDEFNDYSGSPEQQQFSMPTLQPNNTIIQSVFWTEAYKYINNANTMLEGLESSTGLSEKVKKQLEGETRFIRAFCYFYLVNLFGDVPYVTSTDYKVTGVASRSPREFVYQEILKELILAESLLPEDFSHAGNKRVQPNKGAATALLSRVYLYMGDWASAASHATSVIDNTLTYSLKTNLDEVFLANSSEAIWQLMPVIPGANTAQGELFILTDIPDYSYGGVAFTEGFVDSFEAGDKRKHVWVGSHLDGAITYYFPYKYKIGYSSTVSEYSMVLRLAEQYLIRAEARTYMDDISGARQDINVIRHRAGLGDTPASDRASLFTAIEQERRLELFAEWGHRWLDLKRTGRVDDLVGPLKLDWQPTDALYPIPQSERLVNPNLTQNLGY